MFDPVHLQSFQAVAQTLSFTQAAKRLNLRQSTVSQHVRKLEAACGKRLFVRDTHSVALTRDGEAMTGFAHSIMEVANRAHRHFGRDVLSGLIRLGVSEDLVLSGFAHLLREFTGQNPDVVLELTVDVSESLRHKLERGDLDLALIKRDASGGEGDFIWREPLIWIAASDFHLKAGQPVPLIVLAPPAITRARALAALEHCGTQWQLVCTSSSQSGIHAAVTGGLGVAPHAHSLVPSGLVEINDPYLPLLGDIEFVVIGGRQTRLDPWRALVETIKSSGPLLRENILLAG